MLRQIGGVLAATLAAPYVGTCLLVINSALFDSTVRPSNLSNLFGILPLGTMALLAFGIQILAAAALLAFLVTTLAERTRLWSMAGGGLLGISFIMILSVPGPGFDPAAILRSLALFATPENAGTLLAGILSGALCGWIYWRVALKSNDVQVPPRPPAFPQETSP